MEQRCTYYDILDVPQDASIDTIRKAYHKLALLSHPDKVTGAEVEFFNVSKAWEILGSLEKRKAYDSRLTFNNLQTVAVTESVFIGDFDRDEEGNYFYCCRCQEEYVLSQADVDLLERYVTCFGCSLTIEVVYSSHSS